MAIKDCHPLFQYKLYKLYKLNIFIKLLQDIKGWLSQALRLRRAGLLPRAGDQCETQRSSCGNWMAQQTKHCKKPPSWQASIQPRPKIIGASTQRLETA